MGVWDKPFWQGRSSPTHACRPKKHRSQCEPCLILPARPHCQRGRVRAWCSADTTAEVWLIVRSDLGPEWFCQTIMHNTRDSHCDMAPKACRSWSVARNRSRLVRSPGWMTTVPSGGVSSGRRTRTVELQACEHVGRISVLQLPPSVRGWYFGFVDPTRETLPRGLLSSKTAATDWPRHRPGVFCLPAEVIPTSVYRPNRWPLFLFFCT
jgi:hypothetical protein